VTSSRSAEPGGLSIPGPLPRAAGIGNLAGIGMAGHLCHPAPNPEAGAVWAVAGGGAAGGRGLGAGPIPCGGRHGGADIPAGGFPGNVSQWRRTLRMRAAQQRTVETSYWAAVDAAEAQTLPDSGTR